jgi:hypothetical protein
MILYIKEQLLAPLQTLSLYIALWCFDFLKVIPNFYRADILFFLWWCGSNEAQARLKSGSLT